MIKSLFHRLWFILACILIQLSFSSIGYARLPTIIYENDMRTYRKIFEQQVKGNWVAADKEIKKIKNDLLMGYVLHQRFMSPYYKTKFSEVKDWLLKYGDQPNAMEIYNLGLRKGAKKELRRPVREAQKTQYFNDDFRNSYQMIQHSYNHLNKKERGDVNYMIKIFNRRLKQGYTKNAREILENPSAKRFFAKNDYLRMQAYLAFTYFLNGEDDMAILWGEEPSLKLNFYLANWTLGLVYYRAGDYKKSRDYFKNIAFTKQIPADILAAANYWAYRTNEKIENRDLRDDSDIFLETASNYPKTFYGILASKKLNKKLNINWEEPDLTLQNAREIISWQGGVRALALLQLDMKKEASDELRFLINTASDDFSSELINAVLGIAELAGMPHLAINVANYKKEFLESSTFSTSIYPLIDIDLTDGWKVDKALINALIRQESRFNPNAKSGAGARGLMQIMPATASFITRDSQFRKGQKAKLYEEALNLKIGQMYIEYLMSIPDVNGNLFKFLVAYNAGPGNLKKQLARIQNPTNDPLFFIEAITLKETRIYIERVMANFWIYRNKLNQESESLNQTINDEWPLYVSKGDIIPQKYTAQEIEYFEDYLEEKEADEKTVVEENSDESLEEIGKNEQDTPEI